MYPNNGGATGGGRYSPMKPPKYAGSGTGQSGSRPSTPGRGGGRGGARGASQQGYSGSGGYSRGYSNASPSQRGGYNRAGQPRRSPGLGRGGAAGGASRSQPLWNGGAGGSTQTQAGARAGTGAQRTLFTGDNQEVDVDAGLAAEWAQGQNNNNSSSNSNSNSNSDNPYWSNYNGVAVQGSAGMASATGAQQNQTSQQQRDQVSSRLQAGNAKGGKLRSGGQDDWSSQQQPDYSVNKSLVSRESDDSGKAASSSSTSAPSSSSSSSASSSSSSSSSFSSSSAAGSSSSSASAKAAAAKAAAVAAAATAPDKKGKTEPRIEVLSLLYDPPVEGCQLRPYVSIMDENGNTQGYDARGPKSRAASSNRVGCEFRWFRGQKRICSNPDCNRGATMQCLQCLKLKLPGHKSYFCGDECFARGWKQHSSMHNQEMRNGHSLKYTPWNTEDGDEYVVDRPDSPQAVSAKFPPPVNTIWAEVSRSRCYTPKLEDVGRAIRIECAPIIGTGSKGTQLMGKIRRIDTSGVLAAPPPPKPRNGLFKVRHGLTTAGHPYKTVCYNVLAQIYATRHMYPYCPVWALAWNFRKDNLLRDLLSHNADIMCLQEVQANHYEKFFKPMLSKHGYDGIFKKKTREMTIDGQIDGCAIFFRRERFALMEQYGIEFNEAARQQTQNRKQLKRLLKGNIALVVVLEELQSGGNDNRRRRKRRLCVANTHIYWDPEFSDVKLWQTWVLCQELEKLVLHRHLPLVLCGDFNSMTDSSVYELLSKASLGKDHPVFRRDPCNILPPPQNITHRLPLASAYVSGMGQEPKYTNYTGHFVGVLDYIFYSKSHIAATSCLDVDSEEVVKEHVALPSPQYPSDHLALVAELDWIVD